MQSPTSMKNYGLPLPTLLSQVLVAFTIEFDNEFEHRTPYRTTRGRAAGVSGNGPWLTSLVMWSNLMRLVRAEGVTVRELMKAARTQRLSLAGMERWGHIVVGPNPADPRPKPPKADWMVWPTAKGRMAQEVWPVLFGVIEERWETRFGKDEIGGLRKALRKLAGELNVELPEYLPVLGYGLFAEVYDAGEQPPLETERGATVGLHLPALLSKVLLAFTLEFEREPDVSLAISANVLRILSEDGMRMRDLPRLAGVSKEAISTAVGFMKTRGFAVVEADASASRGQVVRLTPRGSKVKDAHRRRLDEMEERWRERFGSEAIDSLREALERLVGNGGQESPLFRGLEPYPNG